MGRDGVRRQRLLLEGPHLLEDALDAMDAGADLELEAVLATPEVLAGGDATGDGDPRGGDVRRLLERLAEPPREVDDRVLASVADADSPRGLVAVARRPVPSPEDVPRVGDGIYVYADGLQDPGNLGALARVAEAAGAVALFAAPGTCRLEHPRALRASAGSLLRLPALPDQTPADAETILGDDATWITLEPRGGESLWACQQLDAEGGGPLVLAVGGEGAGLGAPLLHRATAGVTIPMQGEVESLNATVAASLVLFEIARRRADAHGKTR